MSQTTDSITREEVYDIVRDSLGLPHPTANPPADVQTVAEFNKQRTEQAQYQVAGILAPAQIADRNWELSRCVDVLQEATRIRRDEVLMKEIRLFIRQKRDEAATLLDEIG